MTQVTNLDQLKSSQKPSNPVAAFSKFLDSYKPQMALALPKHLTPDRMARLAITAFSSTPKLQSCDPTTIVASIMTASTLGLEIGVDGQGFLVPYGQTCQFVPGWKGLVDLVNRSGNGTVYTGVIFKDQDYTFIDGAKRDLIIHNETDLDDPADITHAYAIGWVKGASMPVIELWRVSKIIKHRDKYNKQGMKHYSFRDWEMYARKIPLLQVIKYMPKSIELNNAIAVNDAAERGAYATIDGSFVTVTDPTADPASDASADSNLNANVDKGTGEIVEHQQVAMQAPSLEDALAFVKSGDLDMAQDVSRKLPESDQAIIEQAISTRMAKKPAVSME